MGPVYCGIRNISKRAEGPVPEVPAEQGLVHAVLGPKERQRLDPGRIPVPRQRRPHAALGSVIETALVSSPA